LSRTIIDNSDYTLHPCPSCGFVSLRMYSKDGHYNCINEACDRRSQGFPYDSSGDTENSLKVGSKMEEK